MMLKTKKDVDVYLEECKELMSIDGVLCVIKIESWIR